MPCWPQYVAGPSADEGHAKENCDYQQSSTEIRISRQINYLCSTISGKRRRPRENSSLIQREVRTAALVSDANTEKGGATIGVGVGIGIGIEKTEF